MTETVPVLRDDCLIHRYVQLHLGAYVFIGGRCLLFPLSGSHFQDDQEKNNGCAENHCGYLRPIRGTSFA